MRRAIFRRNCGAVAPLLWDYASGALGSDTPEAAPVTAHLQTCDRCRREVETCRKAANALAASAATPPGGIPDRPGDWDAVRSRILGATASAPEPIRRRVSRPVLAGALATFAGAGVCAYAIQHTFQADQVRRQTEQQALVATMTPTATTADTADTADTTPSEAPPVAENGLPSPQSVAPPSPLAVDADPCFLNLRTNGVYPVVVTLQNNTRGSLTADVAIETTLGPEGNRWTRQVEIAAGTKRRVFLYPNISFGTGLRVQVNSPVSQKTIAIPPSSSNDTYRAITLIGDHIGGLTPRQNTQFIARQYTSSNPEAWLSTAYYARPEDAPDRAEGYPTAFRTVVLDTGARTLNAAQWQALREWVIRGGSLVLLQASGPQAYGTDALPAPTETVGPVQTPFGPSSPLRSSHLGMGTVLYADFDPTQIAFREWAGFPKMWERIRNLAAPTIPVDTLRFASQELDVAAGFRFAQGDRSPDPFHATLPPMETVVYLFLGYFVLAIPVTFAVLRRTRRMNLAWVTGPLLSFGVTGLLFTLSDGLRRVPMSRRTSGIIVVAQGEREAEFQGTTELFFPQAGSYPVSIPGAQSISSGEIYSSSGGGSSLRALGIVDDGTTVRVPHLNVANRTYRRLSHSQRIPWGEGVTAEIAWDAEGRLNGVIHNRSGRTLANAVVLLPNPPMPERLRTMSPSIQTRACYIGDIPVGDRSIHGLPAMGDTSMKTETTASARVVSMATAPLLRAQLSGESFGPDLGEWKGQDSVITVLMDLPPLGKAETVSVSKQGGRQ